MCAGWSASGGRTFLFPSKKVEKKALCSRFSLAPLKASAKTLPVRIPLNQSIPHHSGCYTYGPNNTI